MSYQGLCVSVQNSVRGKVIAKRWFIRITCLWGLQAGRQGGAMPQDLTGLEFYNQRKNERGRRTSLSFLSRPQSTFHWIDFIWGGLQNHCSHEIKRRLLLGRKAMTNLDSILKSRDVTLPTKVHLVKTMVFPVVMYGCESWTIKKYEHRRIDTFDLWCWRRLLRVPWTASRSNQSILKEISPGCSLEGLMLKLKL